MMGGAVSLVCTTVVQESLSHQTEELMGFDLRSSLEWMLESDQETGECQTKDAQKANRVREIVPIQ